MAARELGDEQRRNLRRIGERLVVDARHARDRREHVGRLHVELGVRRAEMPRNRLRIASLVVARLVEADRKRLHRLRGLRLHQRDDHRRIDAPRQERAKRHVGDRLLGDRIAQHVIELRDGGVRVAVERIRAARRDHAVERPVAARRGLVAQALVLHVGAGRQLADAFVDRVRRGHARVAQIQTQRVAVDRMRAEARKAPQRLQLGAEHERAADAAVIERLLADAIAREREHARFAVPQREREHSDRLLQRAIDAPRGERREQHFAIRMTSPLGRAMLALELAAQLAKVVDLAVERHRVATARGRHRLMSMLGQIDDRQAPMAERDARIGIDPQTGIVRAAMRETVRHSREGRAGRLRCACDRANEAADSAHDEFLVRMVKGYGLTDGRRPSVGRILRRKYSSIIPACSGHFFTVKN